MFVGPSALRKFLFAFACLIANPAAANPPVEAFGSLPSLTQPKIAPDGLHFAAIQALEGKPAAVIYQVGAAPGTHPVVVPSGEATITAIDWVKNDRLVIRLKTNERVFGDNRIRTWERAIAVRADGSNLIVLLKDFPSLRNNATDVYIVDKNLDDPDTILMPLFLKNIVVKGLYEYYDPYEDFRLDLLKVNLDTGVGHIYATGNYKTADWITDGHGALKARLELTLRPLRHRLFVYADGDWKASGSYDAQGDNGAGAVGLTEDGKAVALLRHAGHPTTVLLRHDLATGDESQVLFSDPRYDVMAPIKDEWTGRVIGAMYAADQFEYRYFSPENQALQAGLEKSFPGLSVHATSMSRDKSKVIVAVQGARHPPKYFFLDRTTHAATEILSAYPHLNESDLGEMKPYPYTARDGLEIPAYLTLPPGKLAKNLPTVIMPHGGPDERDVVGFDWWAQFLANRGYAVLQPNFRGSKGYGRAFTEAGLRQWGGKMQDDISDGVKKLIADGIADPKRICIVGASYGGYAALAGATFTPDLYACAMSFAGVSDLNKFMFAQRSDTGQDSQSTSFWTSRVGSDWTESGRLEDTSPARHADAVKCPILLMHGEGDTTVRINQSQIMYDALKTAGKDVQFIRVTGEDHYLNFAATRIQMLKELEAFLKKNIGN
ncbi:MAG TPA: S9 family peptidase [Rhizomicrobium sp.]|nr:S9 family peptidase [Rhizomicrobium sp.]